MGSSVVQATYLHPSKCCLVTQPGYGCVDPSGKIAPLSDLTSANCSFTMWALRNKASVKLAPVNLAPVKLAPVRLAPIRLASVRMAFVRMAFVSIAELRSAANRDVLLRLAWDKLAWL